MLGTTTAQRRIALLLVGPDEHHSGPFLSKRGPQVEFVETLPAG